MVHHSSARLYKAIKGIDMWFIILDFSQVVFPEAHENLMKSFASLEASINARNVECEKNKEITYPYFLPSTCNVSINIDGTTKSLTHTSALVPVLDFDST